MGPVKLLLLLSFHLAVVCVLPQVQRDSLVAFWNATNGPTWINKAYWNSASDPCTSPRWYGVTCDVYNGNVTNLILDNNNLTGSLPDLQLPQLTQ